MDRDKLYEQFSPLINRLVRQYATTPGMRRELLGELNSLFHAFLDGYDASRGVPLHPYLVRHMSASAFSLAHKQQRQEPHESTGYGDHSVVETVQNPQGADALLTCQFGVRLRTLIQSLPLRQKQVLILHYYEDRSFEEIAQMLEIKPPRAHSLLRTALKRLRRQIASD